MDTYTSASIPNVTPTQQGYTLPCGALVIVDITQSEYGASLYQAQPQPHLAITFKVWQVNADGTPVLDSQGKRISPPDVTNSVVLAALSSGAIDLPSQLTAWTIDALNRMCNWLTVHPQVSALLSVLQQNAAALAVSTLPSLTPGN